MTHGAARPPGSHELHEVEAADGRGDESHRDLEGTEQTARHEVRQRQQHRSAPEGRQDAEPRDTREPPGDLRGSQSEESDRPGRRHAGGGENDTVADQHDSCAPGPQSETGGGVVPRLQDASARARAHCSLLTASRRRTGAPTNEGQGPTAAVAPPHSSVMARGRRPGRHEVGAQRYGLLLAEGQCVQSASRADCED